MKNILSSAQLKKIRQAYPDKKIVLVGGCFDVLHLGHVHFLNEARKKGDLLVVFLESDDRIRLSKKSNLPIHSQIDRAKMLESLKAMDFVVLLPHLKDEDYDNLVKDLQPDIIATTAGDPNLHHLIRTAKLVKAKVVSNIKAIDGYSSSKIVDRIAKNHVKKAS